MTGFGVAPPDCDAELFGNAPTVLDGRCRCLVCGRCGHHTGNTHQGHYWAWCKVTRTIRKHHFCCPDPAFGCQLEAEPAPDAATERPSPAELFEKSGGNRDLYRDLLHQHGHLLAPGDEGYDESAEQLPPCGWTPS
jgi:hypothetical protein